MKAKAVGYWICTVLIGLSFLSGGAASLLRAPQVVEGMSSRSLTPDGEFVDDVAIAWFPVTIPG